MEYAAGGSLGDALKKWGMLSENVVRRYTGQILDGLMFLNNRGISHRDIKPGNVLLSDNGTPVIMDFGSMAPARLEVKGRSQALAVQVSCCNGEKKLLLL